MHQKIENEIIAGEAIAIHLNQIDVINAAFARGLKVYVPDGEMVGRRIDWFDKAAGIANRHMIAELREALAK